MIYYVLEEELAVTYGIVEKEESLPKGAKTYKDEKSYKEAYLKAEEKAEKDSEDFFDDEIE